MKYKDLSMNIADSGNNEEFSGTNAIIMAIKNIILSRQGNYPFTPSLGMNIEKYQFDILDEYTLSDIKTELLQQINKFIPAIDNVEISVDKVEEEIYGEMVHAIGIGITAMNNGEKIVSNFLVVKNKEVVSVYNETGNK